MNRFTALILSLQRNLVMRLHFQHYVGAAVTGAAVCAASGPALQAYGIPQMISSAILTISSRGNEIPQRDLPLKGPQAQMVLVGCPAMFGESPHSNLVFRGESITTLGECIDLKALNLVRESKLSTQ